MGTRKYRRKYYDFFSHFYDAFIALHSRDQSGELRKFLVQQAKLKPGDIALDICTGTGSVLPNLHEHVGAEGLVVGLDFSHGMLRAARDRWGHKFSHICFIEADVAHLPFGDNSLEGVTCSHAFYELKGDTQERALREIGRILKKGKPFLMMEHDVPDNPVIKFLFYLRIYFMGSGKAMEILGREQVVFQKYFARVQRIRTPSGGSKIFICRK